MVSSNSSSKRGLVAPQGAGLVSSTRGAAGGMAGSFVSSARGAAGGTAGTFQQAVKRLGLVPEVDQLSLAEPNTPGKYNQ